MPRARRGPSGPRSKLAGRGTKSQPKAKGKGPGTGHESRMSRGTKGYYK